MDVAAVWLAQRDGADILRPKPDGVLGPAAQEQHETHCEVRAKRVAFDEFQNLIDRPGVVALGYCRCLLGVAAGVDLEPIFALLNRPAEHAAQVLAAVVRRARQAGLHLAVAQHHDVGGVDPREGAVPHQPLRPWLQRFLQARLDNAAARALRFLLTMWSGRWLEAISFDGSSYGRGI
jgi:hypothetical protein